MNDEAILNPERGPMPIGIAAQRLLYEVKNRDSDEFLKGHPGRAEEVLILGMPRVLSHHALIGANFSNDDVRHAVIATYRKAERLCDSPIERNLLAGLLTGCWFYNRAVVPVVVDVKNYDEAVPHEGVVIIPQFQFGRYRFDFLVRVELHERVKLFCLECDGKEFHEDKARDDARNDFVRSLGVHVHRYSGTQLHNEPLAASNHIIDAIGLVFGFDH